MVLFRTNNYDRYFFQKIGLMNTNPQAVSLFPDTHPDAAAVLISLLRQAPPWRKLQMVSELNQTVRTLALNGLRQRYPNASPQELDRRLADILLGSDLATRAYGSLKVQGDI
jgi:hypothetical protein